MEGKLRGKGALCHKEGCRCHFCSARRRKAETQPESAGDGRNVEVLKESPEKRARREVTREKELVLNANLPVLEAGPNAGRARLMQWLAIKAKEPTLQTKQIAIQLGIAPATLYTLISRATREGWLKFDDPLDRLEHEIIPKAMDNLSSFMDEKDKQATIETMKATVFKHYQESKGIQDNPTTILALKIETVDPSSMKVITGHVVGKPRTIGETNEA